MYSSAVNNDASSFGYGISAGTAVVCRVCTATDQHNGGFYGEYASSFVHCLAINNGYYGFKLNNECSVRKCLLYHNGASAPSGSEAGIMTIGNGNRICDNHVIDNWRGIVINGYNNLVSGNSLYNQMNITNSTGNCIGTLIPSGSLGEDFTTSNPWANFGL
jgi:hypothetical protein